MFNKLVSAFSNGYNNYMDNQGIYAAQKELKNLGVTDVTQNLSPELYSKLSSDTTAYLGDVLQGSAESIAKFNSGLTDSTGEGGLASALGSGMGWLGDNKELVGGLSALGGTLMSAFALPSQIKLAETQQDAFEQNIAFAKEDQKRRRENISGFNSFKHNA